ncbi:MAG: alpha-amylase family glycosyl hydrolase, partial [Pseudomonadota bacterium]|nr:alpha-amylase family glycosyl hydrolase [Pseudomonadota bacterium]
MVGQRERVQFLTGQLYRSLVGEERLKQIVDDLVDAIGASAVTAQTGPAHPADLWSQRDVALITYGDSIVDGGSKPLRVLRDFCETWLGNCVTWVHILPFFPWTSDDGFSVLDYSSVNQALGDWNDISDIATDYRLMADLVLNHCSSRSAWFENFKQGIDPGKGYFFTKEPSFDVSRVVRPRTSDLTMPVVTSEGEQQV